MPNFDVSDIFLRSDTRATERRLGSKIESKFNTFDPPPVKLWKGWAKRVSQFFEFSL